MACAVAGGGRDPSSLTRDDYAKDVLEALKRAGLRGEVDLRNEKINYKVREHSVTKVPVLFVCGKREAEERTVSIRRLGSKDQTVMPLDEAIAITCRRGRAAGP